MLNTLKHYHKINDKLHTSAQPGEVDFTLLNQAGIEMVINLARADSPDAINDEAQLVQKNGMDYLNIPVDFKNPTMADLVLFFNAMTQYKDKCLLIHCAYNWRVACFVYLYRVIRQHCGDDIARQDMLTVWNPDDTWQTFIDNCLSHSNELK